MEREQVLSVLYDLTLTIGGEVRLESLLSKVLQRFLYHTGWSVGVILLDQKAGHEGVVQARLNTVIGDHQLERNIGQTLMVPPALTRGPIELLDQAAFFADLNTRSTYRYCLKLPIDGYGVILLLTPKVPDNRLPLTQIFQPVLANLQQFPPKNNFNYKQRVSRGTKKGFRKRFVESVKWRTD